MSHLQNHMIRHNTSFPRAKLARHLRCAALDIFVS